MRNLPFILPANIQVANKRTNVGKEVELSENEDYKKIDFFREGKTGYGIDSYTGQQKKIMNDKHRKIP
jgi:hypothetical protein